MNGTSVRHVITRLTPAEALLFDILVMAVLLNTLEAEKQRNWQKFFVVRKRFRSPAKS